jgi:uncharacterized membrane protein
MKTLLIALFFNIGLVTSSIAPQTDNNDCDTIVLKSGEEISAKVLKIGENEIEYKKCDNQTGPTYTVKPDKVFMVKYANGTKEVIKQSKDDVKQEGKKSADKKKGWIMFGGFLLFTLITIVVAMGGGLAALIAILTGIVALVLLILSLVQLL